MLVFLHLVSLSEGGRKAPADLLRYLQDIDRNCCIGQIGLSAAIRTGAACDPSGDAVDGKDWHYLNRSLTFFHDGSWMLSGEIRCVCFVVRGICRGHRDSLLDLL
jgi:hypothetical protein